MTSFTIFILWTTFSSLDFDLIFMKTFFHVSYSHLSTSIFWSNASLSPSRWFLMKKSGCTGISLLYFFNQFSFNAMFWCCVHKHEPLSTFAKTIWRSHSGKCWKWKVMFWVFYNILWVEIAQIIIHDSLLQFWHITFNAPSHPFSRQSSGAVIPSIKINYAFI